jgi:hypothetical protein
LNKQSSLRFDFLKFSLGYKKCQDQSFISLPFDILDIDRADELSIISKQNHKFKTSLNEELLFLAYNEEIMLTSRFSEDPPTGPMYLVFCRLCPFSPQPPIQFLGPTSGKAGHKIVISLTVTFNR